MVSEGAPHLDGWADARVQSLNRDTATRTKQAARNVVVGMLVQVLLVLP